MIQGLFRKSALFLALAGLTFAAQAYTYKPGTYEVTTRGNAGPLTIVTTFSKNRIEKIEIKSSNDTSYVGGVAMEKVRNEILSKQHLGVDTVSGATMSTAALLRAVGEAAEKAGVKAESLVPHKKPVDPAKLPAEKITTDVVVIGAGGTGLAAAATAAEKGAKVLLIEKMPFAGGSSALAGGALIGLFSLAGWEYSAGGGYMISSVPIGIPLFFALILFLACRALSKKISAKVKKSYVRCVIFCGDKSIEQQGFFDSGNKVYCGGAPVSVISLAAACALVDVASLKDSVSVNTVTGSKRIKVFTADKLVIYSGENEHTIKCVKIGISPRAIHSAVLHPDLAE